MCCGARVRRDRRHWRIVLLALATVLLVPVSAGAAPGDLLVADRDTAGGTGALLRVNPQTGARTLVSANGFPAGGPNFVDPNAIVLQPNGLWLVVDIGPPGGVLRVDPQSGVRTVLSQNTSPAGGPAFAAPRDLALELDGNIVVVDQAAFGGPGGVIRVDPVTGARTAVSENAAPAGGPSFADPIGVTLAPDGAILVADRAAFAGTGGVIRVDPVTGARTAVSENAAPPGGQNFVSPHGIALAPDGAILVADGGGAGGGGVIRVDPQSGARTSVSQNAEPTGGPSFVDPEELAVAADGAIVVADRNAFGGPGGLIRVDPQTGARTTVSENNTPPGPFGFQAPAGLVIEPTPPPPPAPPAPPGEPASSEPPAPPGPSVDVRAPGFLGSIALADSRFAAATRGGSVQPAGRRRRAPVGTRVAFRLDEAASVRFTVERALPGRRAGGRCVKPTRRNRRARRCTRYVPRRGDFAIPAAEGLTAFRFTGRLRNRRLPPGRYRMVAVATDAAGNASAPKRAGFRVVRR
jgi:sugar lactone lactonase YvrE